jgi:hypothetical protein
LRALPFEVRIIMFEDIARRDEPFDPTRTDPLTKALEDLVADGIRLDLTPEEFFDFLIHTPADDAREVLFAGAHTIEEKRRAGAAFVSAISGLIRQGHLAAQEATERLIVAGQVQTGIA